MEVPERSSLEPMPYVMHTRLDVEAVVDTSGEQHRWLDSRPLQSIIAQGATHKLCVVGSVAWPQTQPACLCYGTGSQAESLMVVDHKQLLQCRRPDFTEGPPASGAAQACDPPAVPLTACRGSHCFAVPEQAEDQSALLCLVLQRMIQVMRTPRCRTPISCWARGQLLSTLPMKQLGQPWARGTGRMRGDRRWRWRLWVSAGNGLVVCSAARATPAVCAG